MQAPVACGGRCAKPVREDDCRAQEGATAPAAPYHENRILPTDRRMSAKGRSLSAAKAGFRLPIRDGGDADGPLPGRGSRNSINDGASSRRPGEQRTASARRPGDFTLRSRPAPADADASRPVTVQPVERPMPAPSSQKIEILRVHVVHLPVRAVHSHGSGDVAGIRSVLLEVVTDGGSPLGRGVAVAGVHRHRGRERRCLARASAPVSPRRRSGAGGEAPARGGPESSSAARRRRRRWRPRSSTSPGR